MFKWFRNLRESRRILQMGYTAQQWEEAVADWPVMKRYEGVERDALRKLSFRFIARKRFVSGGGFEITHEMALKIATMACVPILHLGLDWYNRWYSVVVYEGAFVPNRPYRSSDGVVHTQGPALNGEAWAQGPVILSWESVNQHGSHARAGKAGNVVIHEVAHKLDMLRDGANGAPPMHPDMRAGEWHVIFSEAWMKLLYELKSNKPIPIDAYALTSPAEFFAVCSESFFEDPKGMQESMPDVYRLLCQFYRQQPVPIATPNM